jgi:hypothetical protein
LRPLPLCFVTWSPRQFQAVLQSSNVPALCSCWISSNRIYFGADGMAMKGLRCGAAIEIREYFGGQASNTSASTFSSSEALFVRRAFTQVVDHDYLPHGLLRNNACGHE